MFNVYFEKECFYFSPTLDLTNPLGKLADGKCLTGKLDSYDERFFYNKVHLSSFVDNKLTNWIQPFINGLVEYKLMKIGTKSIGFALISKRDKSRAGMRFLQRGCDMEGNVSNFAETEQVLIIHNDNDWKVYSYL